MVQPPLGVGDGASDSSTGGTQPDASAREASAPPELDAGRSDAGSLDAGSADASTCGDGDVVLENITWQPYVLMPSPDRLFVAGTRCVCFGSICLIQSTCSWGWASVPGGELASGGGRLIGFVTTSDRVLWTHGHGAVPDWESSGAMFRSSLDATSVTLLRGRDVAPSLPLAAGERLLKPGELALHGDRIYWAEEERFCETLEGNFARFACQSGARSLRRLVSAPANAIELQDDAAITVLTEDSLDAWIPVASASPDPLSDLDVRALAADDNFLYWVAPSGVFRLRIRGGRPTLLSPVVDGFHLLLDGEVLYVQTEGNGGRTIVEVPITGGPATVLVEKRTLARMTQDASFLYYGTESSDGCGTLERLSKSTRVEERIATIPTSPTVVALDEGHYYWATSFGLYEMKPSLVFSVAR